jgi:PAS domain S-box-containing protein
MARVNLGKDKEGRISRGMERETIMQKGIGHVPKVRSYVIAAFGVLLAFGLRLALRHVVGDRMPFLLFMPAALFAAWYGGVGPGLAAAVAGLLLGDYFFVAPMYSFKPQNTAELVVVIAYFLESMAGVLLVVALRRKGLQFRHAHQRSDELAREIGDRHKAEQGLRESEERLRLIVESAKDFAIFLMDLKGSITTWNPGAESMFGYARKEILGRNAEILFTPEDREHHAPEQELEGAARNDRAEDERWHLRKDGTRVYASGVMRPVRDEKGQVTAFLKVARDITPRKQAEDALKASEAEFRATFYGATVAQTQTDPVTRRFLRVNAKFAEITGYSEQELLKINFSDVTHPDDRETDLEIWKGMIRGESPEYHNEKRYVRKDGTIIWVNASATLIRDAAGKPIRTAAIIQDITGRKQAEEELRRSEWRLRSLVEGVKDYALYIYDAGGRIITSNSAVQSVDGFAPEEIIGRHHSILFSPEQIKEGKPDKVLKLAAEQGRYEQEELRRRKDGSMFWTHMTLTALRDETGKLYGYSKVCHDITESKKAQEKIRKLNEELEQRVRERTSQLEMANRELEAFNYSVSHDLRAPLRIIHGFANVLEESSAATLNDESREALAVISDSAMKMRALIDDLLAFSRIGRSTMRQVTVSLNSLIDEVREELRLDVANRKIVWNIAPLPLVNGDPGMLHQVILNLLSNALKYTRPRDEARIEIGWTPGENEDIFFVRDNGVGFDPQYADSLFGVFQRLHSTQQFEGTGIGLAIVRRVIARHDGRTWAEGAVDKGATFYFSLSRPAEIQSGQPVTAPPP